ncbi:MAG: XRE family transcriptional regulator [Lachnospiraceae bacterium]|nr:XRE family transcriptional regulator [Lachnospiraceae bacterium]
MGFIDGIGILLLKKKSNKSDLARRLGESQQNLGKKFKRNTLKDEDIKQIALAYGCDFVYKFVDRETEEIIYEEKL